MRNRALHDALRDYALEAAALLTEDLQAGTELQFDVEEDRARRGGPALYRYTPRTGPYIRERWPRLCELPSCRSAADALGAGASSWLRVNGLGGAQAEPALQAMLERLYEDATSFGFPEERFERLYAEVEQTLYRDSMPSTVVVPLDGVALERDRVELGDGLSLAPGGAHGSPTDCDAVCVIEGDIAPDGAPPVRAERERLRRLVTGLRLFKGGAVALGAIGWRRAGEARWIPFEAGGGGEPRGEPWLLHDEERDDLREFLETVDRSPHAGAVSWALARFEMGCSRALDAEGLSDYLLALRALLDATTDAGRASLALRLAALCAEEGRRRGLQRRVELAFALERYVMGGGREGALDDWIGPESPRALVHEIEGHTRALLRDVLCGYLEPDLKAVADEIMLERAPEPDEIRVRDTREEPEADTAEIEPPPPPRRRIAAAARAPEPEAEPEPVRRSVPGGPEGVTPSADWDEYSAPV